MTTVPGTNFTKEQLEADIEVDNVSDGGYSGSHKLNRFGVVYHYEKQKYDKALAWYILAARENNPRAQNNIGTLYRDELGVPKNYLCALKWFLKAAQLGDNPNIFNNVGNLFERGYGVPFDRYKALEWYCHGGVKYRDKLKSQGYHRSTADKKKTLQQLITETEAILEVEKIKLEAKQDKTQQEMATLEQLNITYKLTGGRMNAWKDVPILFAGDEHDDTRPLNSPVTANDNDILELKKQIQQLTQEKLDLKLEIVKKDKEIILLKNDKQSLQQENSSAQHRTKDIKMNSLRSENQELKLKSISLQTENQSLQHKVEEYEQQTKSRDNTIHLLESDSEDINYDTPSEDEDNNNDLNYDDINESNK